MIPPSAGTRIWIAAGVTDMRRGFDGLTALVQTQLQADPFSGHVFVFRGRRGDRIKVLWWDGDGLCLFAKRLEYGRFVFASFAVINLREDLHLQECARAGRTKKVRPVGALCRPRNSVKVYFILQVLMPNGR